MNCNFSQVDPPPKPEPPPSYLICDKCWKPSGTCWCKAFHVAMAILAVAAIMAFYAVAVLCAEPVLAERPATTPSAHTLTPNNGGADNGPALSYYAQNSIPVPAGHYYAAPTIETDNCHGGKLAGIGRTCEKMADYAYSHNANDKPSQQPVTVLVNSKAAGALLHVQRQGFVVEDLTLQGARLITNDTPAGTGSLVDFEQATGNANFSRPLGNCELNRVTLLSAAYGVRIMPGNHCDGLRLRGCVSEDCNIVYQSNELQSVECKLDLTVKGTCQYVLDMRAGGRFKAHIALSGQCSGAILAMGDADLNTGPTQASNYYEIFVFLDDKCRDVRIVEERTSNHPSIVKVRGFAGPRVTFADPPVIQKSDSHIDVKIDQWTPKWEYKPIVWPEGRK